MSSEALVHCFYDALNGFNNGGSKRGTDCAFDYVFGAFLFGLLFSHISLLSDFQCFKLNDRAEVGRPTEEEQADKEDGNGTTITFINTRDIASVTGVPGSGMILAIVSGLALAAAGIILRRKMRHKHKEVE